MNFRFSKPTRYRLILWDGVMIIGGGLLIGLTLQHYSGSGPSYSHHAHETFSKAEADRRIESAKAYLTTHPEDLDSLTTLAVAYYQKGPDSYVDGVNALEKARALGATDAQLFYYAGTMYDALGLPDYAVNEYSKFLRHYPKDYETLVRLGNVYFHQKHYDEALNLYKEALREYPKDPTVWFNYAIVNKEKGDYAGALTALDRVRKLAGHLPEGGLYEEGEIYRLQGDDGRALASYTQELVQHSDYIPALEAEETLARKRQDYKGARELHKRILELKKSAKSPTPA